MKTERLLKDEANTELLRDIVDAPSLLTTGCPLPSAFVSASPQWTAEEAEHIETCPHCQSRSRAARKAFGGIRPDIARSRSSQSEPYFFPAIAGKDSFDGPFRKERMELLGGIEFTVKTRKNRCGRFVCVVCVRQKFSEASVVIKSCPADKTAEAVAVAEASIEFIEFSSGKWCGEAEFDMSVIEERLNGSPFSVGLIFKSENE